MLTAEMWGAAYLIIVRAGVLAAGIISIICGYRLFRAEVLQLHPTTPVTEVTAKFSGAELTLKAAAPGTCFALFGVVVIAVTMASAPPQFDLTRTPSVSSAGVTSVKEELRMRGGAPGLEGFVEEAKREEKQGNKKKATEGYENALRLIAEPANNLAWLYHEAGQDKEAAALAAFATQVAPTSAEFADTLKKVRARERR